MGFGDFLRKFFSLEKPKVEECDRIWLTMAGKLRGIVDDIAASRSQDEITLAIAHFPDMLAGMRKLFQGTGRAFELVENVNSGREWIDRIRKAGPETVFLAQSNALPSLEQTDAVGTDAETPVSIILIESHPLPHWDQTVRDFAEALPFPCRLQVHVSLDDALMRVFAGEWVSNMLRRLGMKEDEAIESRMVMKRVRAAQKKIERETVGETPANSAEEWFRLNCPQLAPKE